MKVLKEALAQNFYECNQHKKRILDSKDELKSLMPLSVEEFLNLKKSEISFLDQLIFRFSKLQDSMGEKVFSKILILLGEEIKKKSFIDRLNRLEELELLNKNEWLFLRKIRNEIAHEYSNNQDEIVESINSIYTSIEKLLKIYNKLYTFCIDKFKLDYDFLK